MNSARLRQWVCSAAMLLLTAVIGAAAEGGGTNAPTPTAPPVGSLSREEPALVMVFNRPIVVLRARSFGYSPAERARRLSERLEIILGNRVYGPVARQAKSEGVLITVGGQWTFLIQPEDVDPLADTTLETTVQEAVQRLTVALDEARLQHSTPYVLAAAGKALATTAVFIATLFLVFALSRRMLPRIQNVEHRIIEQFTAHGFVYLAKLVQASRWGLNLASWAVILFFACEWMSLCLHWFPYTRPWGDGLQAKLWGGVSGMFHSLAAALPNLLVIAVIIVITRGVVGILRSFFSGIENGKVKTVWMDVEAARATRRILTILIWLFAVVMIYPYIPGSDSSAFKGVSVFIGVLLSLGSSSVMGQFTSGLVLMYSRALKPGEYVRIDEHEGLVESLGFLSTKLRSNKNEEVHVPNTLILGTTVRNYSRLAEQGGLLLHTTVTIGYNAPWRQVHALLIAAARATPGLAPAPPPFVLQTALSDFYVEYQINACLVIPRDRIRVLAALHANIQDQFNASGVQIMSPHFEADKDRPVIVPRDKWFTPPASQEPSSAGPGLHSQ